jgi:hypothetical protein
MELTSKDLVYIFNCISQHVNRTNDSLDDAVDYIVKDCSAFVDLKDRMDLMLSDIEHGTDLMMTLLEGLEDLEEYDSVRKQIREKQEDNEKRRILFQKTVEDLNSDQDE